MPELVVLLKQIASVFQGVFCSPERVVNLRNGSHSRDLCQMNLLRDIFALVVIDLYSSRCVQW